MSKPTREACFSALFDLVKTVKTPVGASWGVQEEGVRHWDNVPAEQQPYMGLQAGTNNASQAQALFATIWKWEFTIWVYFRRSTEPKPAVSADRIVLRFMDVFDKVMQPVKGEPQTLGGLVYHCFIDGTIGFDAGVGDNQAVIAIPVTVMTGM